MKIIKPTSSILLVVALWIASSVAWTEPVRYTQVVLQATPSETLTATPASAISGTSVRFDVNLTGVAAAIPTGSIAYTLTLADGSTPLTSLVSISAGAASWSVVPPVGTYNVTAVYSGDTNYRSQTASTSSPSNAIAPDFDFNVSTVTLKQGETWTGNLQVFPIGGFTGSVMFSCTAPSSVGCSFPSIAYSFSQAVPSSSKSGSALTVTAYPGQFVGASLFLVAFTYRTRRRSKARPLFGIVIAGLALLMVSGCGTNGNVGWKPITPKGKYQATITGVSGSLRHSKQFTIVVH